MADYTMLVAYVSVALGVSFLCSILEAVLLSMSISHVSVINKSGDKNGIRLASLKEDDSVKPLTAILTLNTIAHTMGAAGVGAEVSNIWGDEKLTIASIILTLAVLFLSEIIPLLQEYFYSDWNKVCQILGCPYDLDTGEMLRENKFPMIQASMLTAMDSLGFEFDEVENSLRYEINPEFVSADENILIEFFNGV